MILVDTSAWIELFDATESSAERTLVRLLDEGEEVGMTEVVAMELLAGATSRADAAELRAHALAFPMLQVGGLAAYELAAELYRRCRDRGETVGSLPDCLIAAVAIEAGAPVLHCDRHFDALARHTPLEVVPLDD